MADFTTPFGNEAPDDRRLPNTLERERGFVDGAAIRTLFNGLFYRLESELGHLMSQAGISGDDADNTQVYQAVQALIESATGSGATENYIQFGQIAQTLPIYPEIQTTDNKLNVTSPASNQARVPSGIGILHRGVKVYTTAQTDMNLDHSSIYHIRWSPTGGAVAMNLADSGYNPDNDPETHEKFDSTLDDVLLARVTTNSNGVLTITNLKNAAVMNANLSSIATNIQNPNSNTMLGDIVATIDWARKPRFRAFNRSFIGTGYMGDRDFVIYNYGATVGNEGQWFHQFPVDRYGSRFTFREDGASAFSFDISFMA